MISTMQPIFLLALVGCSDDPVGDSGLSQTDDTGSTAEPFEPVVFLVEETWAASDGADLAAFAWADGAVEDSTVTFTFLTEDWFLAQEPAEACSWVGVTTVLAKDTRDQETLWAGFEIGLELVETDCVGFDPTEQLESAPMWTGYGPLEELEGLAKPWFEDHGEDWADWQPHAFAQSLALWIDDATKVVKTSVVLGYALEDGLLGDDPSPLTIDDGLPAGALHGLGMLVFEIEKLP